MIINKEIGSGAYSAFQVVVLVLSIYVICALFIEVAVPISPGTRELLRDFDYAVCLVFLLDFSIRFYQAPSKRRFMKWGWIDLLSSIPSVDFLRAGRIFQIVRVLRAFRSARTVLGFIMQNRAQHMLAAVASAAFVLTVFSSIAILHFETGPGANIKTPGDAMWWAFVTMTTVGYGDRFPVTHEGRLIAVLLITAGVSLFGTFTGYAASMFVEPELEKDDTELAQLIKEMRALRTQVDEMQASLNYVNREALAERPELRPAEAAVGEDRQQVSP